MDSLLSGVGISNRCSRLRLRRDCVRPACNGPSALVIKAVSALDSQGKVLRDGIDGRADGGTAREGV
jgi:hypothetical protein